MLNPADRSLLLECLRPPSGYQIDHAIGTSYSLDLLALLAAPLAFTFFDWEEDDGAVTAAPLAVLEAIRRHAQRITLFCQAGEIKLPPATQRLTAYLEGSVVEVSAPNGGVFHPKLWLLRFIRPDAPTLFRCAVLSRNLTMDRSWDTVVVLDGEVADRKVAIAANHPLGEFIEALPRLALKPINAERASTVSSIAQEVRKVRWTLPDGVDECRFWPIGIDGRQRWPFDSDIRRPLLVMSPFLSDGLLTRLTERSASATLISRPDSLSKLHPETLGRFQAVYAFTSEADEGTDIEVPPDDATLSGLHAKMYVIDDGWRARVFLGSANATNAAFAGNVEFVVELAGAKKDFGITALLSTPEGRQTGLISLLQAWTPTTRVDTAEEAIREALEDKLEHAKRAIARIPLTALAEDDRQGGFSLTVMSDALLPVPPDVAVGCWPITLRSDRSIAVGAEAALRARFDGLALEALTGFVAFSIRASEKGITVVRHFAVSARTEGMPSDRLERLLASMLSSPEHLLRLLWLLLEAQGGLSSILPSDSQVPSATPWAIRPDEQYPIFERVLRALTVNRESLKDIGRLIRDLSRTPEGVALLPPGLTTLWDAVRAAAPDLQL